ncbi:hypothetical protein IED13_04155 [Bosea sp. SSUT16]|uniref:Uncharacterized protein n=1 Tax=Bosea spartocytisi TaxID=2773451 RepID=A0A927E4Z1_9HYPH|nr:hypothetical protein [Bosea spartocytisi]MBD3844878.1 hypothetical protein [Bosea spartocytisi]MCT4471080.1 hypothetical protein [Bosea spartocytisi]
MVSDIASAIDIRGPQGPSGSVTDGDKGDIVVSSAGTVWTVDDKAITLAKQADVAPGVIMGRATADSGPQEALTPAQARTVIGAVNRAGDTGMTGSYATDEAFSAAGGRAILGRSGAPQVFLRDLAAGPDLKRSYFYNSAGQSSIGKLNDAETAATPFVTFDHASLTADFSGSIRHTGNLPRPMRWIQQRERQMLRTARSSSSRRTFRGASLFAIISPERWPIICAAPVRSRRARATRRS